MYALVNKEIIKVDESRRLVVLTYQVQDGAGYTVQEHYLMATVPAESESDDTSEERKKKAEAPWS
jgi:hypothetical protein